MTYDDTASIVIQQCKQFTNAHPISQMAYLRGIILQQSTPNAVILDLRSMSISSMDSSISGNQIIGTGNSDVLFFMKMG